MVVAWKAECEGLWDLAGQLRTVVSCPSKCIFSVIHAGINGSEISQVWHAQFPANLCPSYQFVLVPLALNDPTVRNVNINHSVF